MQGKIFSNIMQFASYQIGTELSKILAGNSLTVKYQVKVAHTCYLLT